MAEPIRILHYIGSLNIGGSQKMIINLYKNIDRKKIQFDFIVDKKNELFFKDEIENLGGRIYILEPYVGKNHFYYRKQWNLFFRKHPEYKVIHSHVRSTASIVLSIAKKHGLVTISHSHSTSNGHGIRALIKKILQYKIRFISDYYIGCSKEAAIWLFGKRIAESKKCFILNNAIDSKEFVFDSKKRKTIRTKLGLSDKLVIGQIGRFVPVKNHKYTLNLFQNFIKTHSNSCLLLIGDGPLLTETEKMIDDYGLNKNVLILTNRSDINDLMQAIDIFIMPSLYEGLPLTLIEAQASSLPCIISNNINAGIIIEELVRKIDILNDPSQAIKYIEEMSRMRRKNRIEEVKKSGFDIAKNAKWLTDFYLKIY